MPEMGSIAEVGKASRFIPTSSRLSPKPSLKRDIRGLLTARETILSAVGSLGRDLVHRLLNPLGFAAGQLAVFQGASEVPISV
jgi:hypothetical protein